MEAMGGQSPLTLNGAITRTDNMGKLKENIKILREHYPPLAGIPEEQLRRLIRTYELDPGDGITFNIEQEECVFVLSGEVTGEEGGDEFLMGPHNTLKRPVCLSSGRASFFAKTHSVLGRINPARLDFLLSWESLRTDTPGDDSFRHWLNRLRNPLIFGQLPLENAQEIFRRLQALTAKAGEVIFDMREEATQFYFIEQGQAELWRPGLYDDELKLTKILTVGDYFGEEALLTGELRNARVRMVDDARLLVLDKKDFDELINTPMIERVSAKVARAMLDEGAQLLDIRFEDEYEMDYIPGCKLIPLLELRERVSELDAGTAYVVYCHSGRRSCIGAMILSEHKLQAVSLNGGIRDWPYEIEYPD
jgi:rhodanese-related sulfurtransferase